MKPPKIRDLGTPAWGSKAALKKLSFTWFPTDFDRFKIGLNPIYIYTYGYTLVYIYIYIHIWGRIWGGIWGGIWALSWAT